jgi:dolichol-phosphate mannosyltransferase
MALVSTDSHPEGTIVTETTPQEKPLELAVVIPTFKERENIPHLLNGLRAALHGVTWEAIFVDDHSPDGTADYIRSLGVTNPRVRVIERVGRRGLSSACVEGMMSTAAPYIAIMDADLQHDERILPDMLNKIRNEKLDVVVASRYMEGGSLGEFAATRAKLSAIGTKISRLVCRCAVTDPMSGFFIVDAQFMRETVEALTGTGFKILVDVLASAPRPARLGEVPYRFRLRQHGESKLDLNVELEYLFLLVDKMVGHWVPTRFVLFVMVGGLGVFIHLAILGTLFRIAHRPFILAQTLATFGAMTFNFFLNNAVTFRDRQLRGNRLFVGLLSFWTACSLGAFLNVSFGNFLVQHRVSWLLAGVAGMAISSVWNYGVNTVITWRRSRPSPKPENSPERVGLARPAMYSK